MKRDNKRELKKKDYFWNIYVIILIVMVVLLILFFHFLTPSSPQFTIYKNECHNETGDISNCLSQCSNIYNQAIADVSREGNSDNLKRLIDGDNECVHSCFNNLTTHQVCSQTEVSEINLDGNPSCSYDVNGTQLGCGGAVYIISKNALTTSWLDENCRCVEKVCPRYYHYSELYSPLYNNTCVINSYFYNIVLPDHKNYICQKYSCGDYEVDVK